MISEQGTGRAGRAGGGRGKAITQEKMRGFGAGAGGGREGGGAPQVRAIAFSPDGLTLAASTQVLIT